MTMHMLPIYYTTTSTRKRKKNKKTRSLIAAETAHDKYLRKMNMHPDQIAERKTKSVKCYGSTSDSKPESRGSTPRADAKFPAYDPSMAKKEANVYSGGRKLLGIATLHKSNMVPVFDKESAIEIAKMRRG